MYKLFLNHQKLLIRALTYDPAERRLFEKQEPFEHLN